MGILLSTLKNKKLQLGLIWPIQTADTKANFALVKDMPTKAVAVRTPKSLDPGVVRACSVRHHLLNRIFQEERIESNVMALTLRFIEYATRTSQPHEGKVAKARCRTFILI
jgi:hypothetical protein